MIDPSRQPIDMSDVEPVSLETVDAFPAQVTRIVQRARELQLDVYAAPEAAAKLFERRLKVHPTPSGAMNSAIRFLEGRRRSINHGAEKDAREAWDKANANRAAATDHARRVAERQAMRMRRESRPLVSRLSDALLRARKVGGTRALTVEPDSGGRSAESQQIGPPNAEHAIYDRAERILTALAKGMEHELDALEYGALPEDENARRARIVRDYEGVSADALPSLDPSTGSPSTVRRDRAKAGREPHRGTVPKRAET